MDLQVDQPNDDVEQKLNLSILLIAENRVRDYCTSFKKLEHVREMQARARGDAGDDTSSFWSRKWMRPYRVSNGVLRVPIEGALFNKVGSHWSGYYTGYTYIERAVQRGMDDKNVKGIALDVDSYGGDAQGSIELANLIAKYRDRKPIHSFVNDNALSAGYLMASAGERIFSSHSGMSGSIGVVVTHFDRSGELSRWGVKATHIYAGKHKVEGSPWKPLSKDDRKRMQARVDKIYTRFVSAVAKSRDMKYETVRGTEAAVYDGEEALEVGLVDKLSNTSESMKSFTNKVSGDTGAQESKMDKAPDKTVDRTEIEKAVKAAQQAERQRYSTVHDSALYAGREKLANHMLSTTEMSGEEILAALKLVELSKPETEATPAEPRNHFAEAMDKTDTPNVSASDGEKGPKALKDMTTDEFTDWVFASAGYGPRKSQIEQRAN